MRAEATGMPLPPAVSERVLFWLYQAATWLSFSLVDDPAMLALAFS
jgi:hypothetical protein